MKKSLSILFILTIISIHPTDDDNCNVTIECIGNSSGYLHVVLNEKNMIEKRIYSLIVETTPQKPGQIKHKKNSLTNYLTIKKVELITLEGQKVPVTLHNIENKKLKPSNTLDTRTDPTNQETHIYLNKTYPAAG